MQAASPLPAKGEVFLDARAGGRCLRVSWHTEAAMVVLSLWREGRCVGTFRLTVDEVPVLVRVLEAGLEEAYDATRRARENLRLAPPGTG